MPCSDQAVPSAWCCLRSTCAVAVCKCTNVCVHAQDCVWHSILVLLGMHACLSNLFAGLAGPTVCLGRLLAVSDRLRLAGVSVPHNKRGAYSCVRTQREVADLLSVRTVVLNVVGQVRILVGLLSRLRAVSSGASSGLVLCNCTPLGRVSSSSSQALVPHPLVMQGLLACSCT